MKKHLFALFSIVLAQGAFAADSDVLPLMYTESFGGSYAYSTNAFDMGDETAGQVVQYAVYANAEPPQAAQEVAAQSPNGLDPSMIGKYYLNGGAIFDPSSTHKSSVKANGQYNNPSPSDPANYQVFSKGADLWLRDASFPENSTIADGSTSIRRGNAEQLLTYYIYNNLTGRVYDGTGVDAGAPNSLATFIAEDDPSKSSWTGKADDRPNARQRTADNVFTVKHYDENGVRKMGSYTFVEGNYYGGAGYSGLYANYASNFKIYGSSFIGGGKVAIGEFEEVDSLNGFSAVGVWLNQVGSVVVTGRTGVATDRLEGGSLSPASLVYSGTGVYGKNLDYSGGEGLAVQNATSTTLQGGNYYGSQLYGAGKRSFSFDTFDMENNTLDTAGGDGVYLNAAGPVSITGGYFLGGTGTSGTLGGRDSEIVAHGGNGLWISSSGATTINGGTFIAGKSGSATSTSVGTYDAESQTKLPDSGENSIAMAQGGSGIALFSNGATTMSGVEAIGSAGAVARTSDSNTWASAMGGNGLFAYNTAVTINSGTFTGAKGGTAIGKGVADASGGAGVYAVNQSLTINGGTFTGGDGGKANGQQDWGGAGVWVENANLTIAQTSTNSPTLVNGDVFINNLTGQTKTLAITGGKITGDIYRFGAGTTTMTISTNASYTGSFAQFDGIVNVTLGNSAQSKFFSDVYLGGDSALNLNGFKTITAENASFVLGQSLSESNSALTFAQGLELSKGSSIDTGYGKVKVTANDLVMKDDSMLAFNFDSLSGVAGSVTVTAGNLVASNSNVKIVASGVSATPSGSRKIVTSTGVELGSNLLTDVVDVDFGWLTTPDYALYSTNAGITVGYKYNSLTNSSLSDLNYTMLTNVDSIVSGLSSNEFYALNSGGEDSGTKMFRYSLSELPDVADAAFQEQRQVTKQIVARNTEFRSMNGFASTQPNFNKQAAPSGAAGPALDEEKSMQGWIRAYGAFGNHDGEGTIASYDNNSWGTVIGVDKSFGNLLVGLAGGYGRTEIEANSAYTADIDTYQGSVYSTVGGEDTFIDLALTYAASSTEEENGATKGEFDSGIYSGYLGAGKSYRVRENLSITPEASMLVAYYDQDAFTRTGQITGSGFNIAGYDTWSYLGSIGANFATVHQIDWMNRGMAFIPEIRAHWLHEFNADIDNGSFTTAGVNGSQTLFVRSREEDYLNLGVGFDVWNWKYQNAKFELDYDGLYSSKYSQHTFSGKITVRF